MSVVVTFIYLVEFGSILSNPNLTEQAAEILSTFVDTCVKYAEPQGMAYSGSAPQERRGEWREHREVHHRHLHGVLAHQQVTPGPAEPAGAHRLSVHRSIFGPTSRKRSSRHNIRTEVSGCEEVSRM